MSEVTEQETQTLPLGIDFNQPVMGLDGEPLKDDTKEGEPNVPLGKLVCDALMSTPPNDKAADGTQRLKRFNLALKIKGKSDDDDFPTIRLKDKQEKMVLEMVEKAFPSPLIYARVFEAIKGHTDEDE